VSATDGNVVTLRTDKPRARIIEITPVRAQAILENCNDHNRGCEDRRIGMYAREMRAGHWMFTGEAIKVARDGTLLDGQHRLWALLEAGITLPLLVITGLDPRAQEVMDQGMPRRLNDALQIRGEPDPNNLAAALRVVAHYYRDGVPFQAGSNPGMSHGFALKLFDTGRNREDLLDALAFVRRRHEKGWNSLSMMAGLHFLFSAADETRAIAHTDALLRDTGGTPAARALRTRLTDEYANASIEHPRAHIKARTVFIVLAWNAGTGPPPTFRWTYREGFPGIRGLDDELEIAA
jgi:hypothetical protein